MKISPIKVDRRRRRRKIGYAEVDFAAPSWVRMDLFGIQLELQCN